MMVLMPTVKLNDDIIKLKVTREIYSHANLKVDWQDYVVKLVEANKV